RPPGGEARRNGGSGPVPQGECTAACRREAKRSALNESVENEWEQAVHPPASIASSSPAQARAQRHGSHTNSLANAKLRAPIARNARGLQQSYPRSAIRGAGRAEIGSHSPHYALKVEVLGGGTLMAAARFPQSKAIRREACLVRNRPLFAAR